MGRFLVRSPSALSLSLVFSRFTRVEPGVEVYVVARGRGRGAGAGAGADADADTSAGGDVVVAGPFTHQNVKSNGRFATAPLAGNELVLEIYVPTGRSRPELELASVTHGYRSMVVSSGTYGRSHVTPCFAHALPCDASVRSTRSSLTGSCNINVACENGNGWDDQIRSAAMILTTNGEGFCRYVR